MRKGRLFFILLIFAGINWFFYSDLLAQSGPGGVGSSATNVLWLSADNQVFNNAGTTLASNTDNVQQWNDRSGNNDHASQAVTASRPNYITNVVNGLPVIRFSAGNDHLMATSVSSANVASVWAVAAYASLPSSNPGILIGAPAGTGTNVGAGSKSIGMWVSSAAGTQVWGRGIQSNATSRDISQNTTLSSSTFYIINNIYRAATSINQFVNNAAAGNNNSHNGTLSSWRDVTIGRQGNESWNGDIAEVIFFNTEVNSAQRIIIDNYLSAKYGLSLTSNDVYDKDNAGNGNYDYEVAGIGRVDASNINSDAQGSGIVRILNPGNLGNDEFLIWGHDNGSIQANNLTDVPTGVQGRMVRVWRVSEVNSSSASVDVGSIDIRFDLSGLGSITASDLRLLVDSDNDGLFSDETPISGATLISGTIYEFAGVTAISNNLRFTLGTINKAQTPLPIELVSLEVNLNQDNLAELQWITASEKNNARFEVEKSLGAEDWEGLGIVSGSLNSSRKHIYTFVDEFPYAEISYYRIKQVDTDGNYTYSPIVSLNPMGRINQNLFVYPNPSSGIFSIQASPNDIGQLQIYDVTGRERKNYDHFNWINNFKIELNIRSWEAGIYLLKSGSFVKRIIKYE